MPFTPEQFRRIESIFAEASARTGSERVAVLDQACGDDCALRAELESLLRKDDQKQVGLDSPPFSGALREIWQADAVNVPDRIGNYRILGLLGEGGFGIVYRAEQDRPRRQVALKLLRWGAATPRAMRRFEYETQALARLDHPGVARILEAGTATVAGQSQAYFAMELVEGQRLLDYAAAPGGAAKPLSIAQRLTLLIQICAALQHAHQNGVIHRDLKPDNILVGADGRPRILDFGVARVANVDGLSGTQTRTGQLVGTLPYMSPEQLFGDAAAVDTRTDIYAVGVVAYQLLSGHLPYPSPDSSLVKQVEVLRSSEARLLGTHIRTLRGDIQTIVAKALAKDRTRRYQTAGELGRDIERHLRGEPIEARRDSAFYVLSRTLRRHRWGTAGAAVFLICLTSFAVFAEYQAQTNRTLARSERGLREAAQNSQQLANRSEHEAAKERDEARLARDTAQRQTVRAEAAAGFLERMLGLANPDVTQSTELTTLQMLDRAAPQVDGAFVGQPDSEARVRGNLGRAYAALGESEKAKAQLEQAYYLRFRSPDATPAELYQIVWPLYHVLTDLSDVSAHDWLATAELLNRDVLDQRDKSFANEIKQMALATGSIPDPQAAREALESFMAACHARLNTDDPAWSAVADQLYMRGYRLGYREHPDVAGEYLHAALDLQRRIYPPAHSSILRTLSMMASYEVLAGDPLTAEKRVHEILALLHGVLDDDHWFVTVQRARLGDCLIGQGRYVEAEKVLLECYPKLLQQRGVGNGYVSTLLASLVTLYDNWDRADDARTYRRRLAENLARNIWYPDLNVSLHFAPSLRQVLGPDYADVFAGLDRFNRALLRRRGEPAAWKELAPLLQRVADDDPYATLVADMLDKLTVHYMQNGGRNAVGRLVFEATYRLDCCAPARHPRKSATTHWWLGRMCESAGDFERGSALAFEGLKLLQQVDSSLNGFMDTMASLAGGCLLGEKRYSEAEPMLLESFDGMLQKPVVGGADLQLALDRLVKLYQQTGQPEQAAQCALRYLRKLSELTVSHNDLSRSCWPIVRIPNLKREDYQAALAAAERAAQLGPGSGALQIMLAGARVRCGMYAEADAALNVADNLGRTDALESDTWRALARLGLGDRSAALEAYQRATAAPLSARIMQRRPGFDALLAEVKSKLDLRQ